MAQTHDQIAHLARKAVLAQLGTVGKGGRRVPGAVRRRRATRRLARELDRLLTWPDTPLGKLAEAADGPILLLLEGVIQVAYNELRAEGHPLESGG